MKRKLTSLMISGILFIQSAGMVYGADFSDGINVEIYNGFWEQSVENIPGKAAQGTADILEFSDNDENMAEEQFSGGLDEEQAYQDEISDEKNHISSAQDLDEQLSGNCGENLKWELNSGILTISGEGEMDSYNKSPWYNSADTIKEIVISQGVTSIGDGAFKGCSGLTDITIPNSVTSIGEDAFRRCSGLTSITIPDSVTSIGEDAFRRCSRLTDITIPNSVTRIEQYAFDECSGLTSITISSNITSIEDGVFSGCSGLTNIIIPNGVVSIGDYTFDECGGLTSITIPDGVKSIGDSAFKGCSKLTDITIPDSVKSIGENAFDKCSGLISITIPNGVKNIKWSTFNRCSGLTSVTIPNGVTNIGEYVFNKCSGLTSITIPGSVTNIGGWAFDRCNSLTDVYYNGSKAEWKKINVGSDNECLTKAKIHYKDSSSPVLDICKAEILSVKKSYEYTGKAIKPILKLSLKNKTLTWNRDYTVSYKNNKKIGTATITIKGIGKYSGTKKIQFQIVNTPKLDNLKTTYTIKSGKEQKADIVKIAEKGKLIVDGSLNAKKIYINKGGKLIINTGGSVESSSVIVQGGKTAGGGNLKNSGLLKASKLTIKDAGIISMDGSSQTIVYNEFNMSTNSTKSSLKGGELFIDGLFTLNGNSKNFVADKSGTFKTIFCNIKGNNLKAKSNNYNLGTVCVVNQKVYRTLKLKSQNYNSVLIYTGLKKPVQKRWSYTLTGKTL